MTPKAEKKLMKLLEEVATNEYVRCPDWKGREVYLPVSSETMYIGDPFVFFVRGNRVRMASLKAANKYLDYIYAKMDEAQNAVNHD
ncbi:MAG: hypothetical protein LUD50_01790 [Clostridia bacterium]|nr:hypothetical protein [Clostridia bacterium]